MWLSHQTSSGSADVAAVAFQQRFAADTSVGVRDPRGSACTSPRGASMLLVQQKPKSLGSPTFSARHDMSWWQRQHRIGEISSIVEVVGILIGLGVAIYFVVAR